MSRQNYQMSEQEEFPKLPACFVKWLRNSDRACHFDLIAQAFNSQAGFPKSYMATVWSWKIVWITKNTGLYSTLRLSRCLSVAIKDCVEVFTAGKRSLPRWVESFYWIVAISRSGLDFPGGKLLSVCCVVSGNCVMLQHPSQYYVITP